MKKIFSLIFISVFGFSAVGQTKDIIAITEDGKKVVLKPDKTWDYKEVKIPVNILSTKNGKTIVGDDPQKVGNFFETIKSKILKGERETEKEYLARVDKITNEIKFNGKPLNNTVFIVKPDLSYDAESQAFTVLISINYSILETNNFSLELKKWQYGKYTLHYTYLRLKILPEKAKEATPNIQLAIYGFPVGFEKGFSKLALVPVKYVFFNKKTGEIYPDVAEIKVN